MEKQQAAIRVLELTHYYNTLPAVNKISFEVEVGSIFGLLGPNGAGKTTTIKMLTTLLPPTSGTATILGFDIRNASDDLRKKIGYLPQFSSADTDLTGYENLVISAKLYGLDSHLARDRISEVIEFMGMTTFANQLVREYSGGMVRRLEIAQAIMHKPEVLFLDEPTVELDPGARKALWQTIQDLRESTHTTILMTTHDMYEADKLCNKVAFMHQGHIVANDTPAKLKANLGPDASLNDVFLRYTGNSLHAKP